MMGQRISLPISRLRRVLLVGTALVGALALGCTGLFAAWLAGIRVPIASGATYLRVEKIAPLAGANRVAGGPTTPFFILLVGNDFRPGVPGSRGDALHLLGVNPKLKQASMLDIPRDTCWQGDKINAANTHGACASATAVGGLVGVPVSYVVQVNFDGFTNLVDGTSTNNHSDGTEMRAPAKPRIGTSRSAELPCRLSHGFRG